MPKCLCFSIFDKKPIFINKKLILINTVDDLPKTLGKVEVYQKWLIFPFIYCLNMRMVENKARIIKSIPFIKLDWHPSS